MSLFPETPILLLNNKSTLPFPIANNLHLAPQPRDSDIRKSVFDLFLGQAFEGPVEKKLRQTGEWLVGTAETRFRSSEQGKEATSCRVEPHSELLGVLLLKWTFQHTYG